MEKVKLVIWDLDETFWKGTISDENVKPIKKNIELVKKLTDRGIVNSICSKNDFDTAKKELEKEGVWDYFVFPSIDWNAKGPRVKQIISDMNLRPVNVVFVDDNVNNLKEASFFVPEIQTALPEDMDEMIKDEAFKGKDDSGHSRLNQYKLLEVQAEEKKNFSSNEEFLYQSDIHVELIEDCSDKLERIHEMIHRNNQLNFTKDRISQEEVNRIFTDPDIRSGYVKVKDKYGDHGIVGCYAVKDGRTLQLVLSCRILNMGVEQWLYSELGYPELTVVGEVAAELNKVERPGWINQKKSDFASEGGAFDKKEGNKADEKRFIAYGTCPLRPVWAYIEPQLSNCVFAEMDPGPSVCNLAVINREKDETKEYWLKSIKLFDDRYSFDKDIYSDETGYILITLDGEMDAYKYTSKKDGKSFYIKRKLDASNSVPEILDEYSGEKVKMEDIEQELSYFAENLPKETKLLLMTIPETEFPILGKDANYRERIELNKVAERLEDKYDNIHLIDVRKYAKSPADFFDSCSNHYNRAIGNKIATEILEFIFGRSGSESAIVLEQEDNLTGSLPDNAHITKVLSGDFTGFGTNVFIRNGLMVSRVVVPDGKKEKDYEYKHVFIRGRFIENDFDWNSSSTQYLNVNKTGEWRSFIYIREKNNPEKMHKVKSRIIDFRINNILNYYDPKYSMYSESIKETDQFFKDNELAERVISMNTAMMAEISSYGHSISEYFKRNGISELYVFTDKKTSEIVMPYLLLSDIKIMGVYTSDNLTEIKRPMDEQGGNINVEDLNDPENLPKNKNVLFATDHYQSKLFSSFFKKRKCKLHWLNKILCTIKTEIFLERFSQEKKVPVSVVRLGTIKRFWGMSYSYIKPSEKKLEKLGISRLKNDILEGKELLDVHKGKKSVLKETLIVPELLKDDDGVKRFKDVCGKYLNIENGFRKTENSPDEYEGTIYLFGGILLFGTGVKDKETIASYLQSLLIKSKKPYRVVNVSNSWGIKDFSDSLKLMNSMKFGKKDIVVLLTSGYRHETWAPRPHWFEWDGVDGSVYNKIDTFPLFAEAERDDYFLLESVYSPEGNKAVAGLISEKINNVLKLNREDLSMAESIEEIQRELEALKKKFEELTDWDI